MPEPVAGRVQIILEATAQQLHSALGRVRSDAKQSVDQLNKDFKRAGVGLIALGGAAVKMAATFDKELTEVASLMDGVTKKQIKAMGDELKTLSVTANQSLSSLTKARYDIVSAGFTDAADSAMLLDSAATLATATISDAGTTGAVLTKVLNAYGKTAKEAATVSNILAVGIKKGQTTMAELAPTIGQVIPTAAELGVGLDEIVAGIATLTAAAGQQTPEAMTALNASLVSFLKPSQEMTTVLQSIGFESGRALLKTKGFAGGMAALEKAASNLNMDIADVFPNIRAMRAAFPLAGKQAGIFANNLKAVREDTGALGSMFKTVAESDSFKLEQGIKRLNVSMVELGSVILPEVAKLAGEVSRAFKENSGAIESLGRGMAFIVDHAAELTTAFVAFKALKMAFHIGTITMAFTGMTVAASGFLAILAPVAVALAGTAALFAGFQKFSAKQYELDVDTENLDALFEKLDSVTEELEVARKSTTSFSNSMDGGSGALETHTRRLEVQRDELEKLIKAQREAAALTHVPSIPEAAALPLTGKAEGAPSLKELQSELAGVNAKLAESSEKVDILGGSWSNAAGDLGELTERKVQLEELIALFEEFSVAEISPQISTGLSALSTAAQKANNSLQKTTEDFANGTATADQYAVAIEAAAKADAELTRHIDLQNQAAIALGVTTQAAIGRTKAYGDAMAETALIFEEATPKLFPAEEMETFSSTLVSEGLAAWSEYSDEIELGAARASAAISVGSELLQIGINEQIAIIKKGQKDKIKIARDTADAEEEAVKAGLDAGTISAEEAATRRAEIASTLADTIIAVDQAGNAAISEERRKQKPFLIAEAIVNTAVGATKALTVDPTGILSAITIALGMAQVATIASQKFQSGTSIVPGFGSGDIVPTHLEPQEAVLNREAVRDIGLSEIDSRNRGTFGDSAGVTLNVAVSTLDAQSFEDNLNTTWRDALVRVTRNIFDRGSGAANT